MVVKKREESKRPEGCDLAMEIGGAGESMGSSFACAAHTQQLGRACPAVWVALREPLAILFPSLVCAE